MRFHLSKLFTCVGLALMLIVGCSGGSGEHLAIPDSPDGTIRVVMQGLTERQPVVVWHALPASYQEDVTTLTRDFADTIDSALFDRTVVVARKGVVVLQSKKDLVLGCQTIADSQVDTVTMDAVWEATVHMLDAVLASEAADLATLRELDIEAFLSTTGAALMENAASINPPDDGGESLSTRLAELQNTEVELVSQDGDSATIRVTPPDAEPEDVEMVRIEGRWLPTDLVAQWPGMMGRTRDRIEFLGSEDAAQTRVQLLFAIGMAEGFIDQIDQMETSDQIDDLIGGILGNIIATQGGGMVTEG